MTVYVSCGSQAAAAPLTAAPRRPSRETTTGTSELAHVASQPAWVPTAGDSDKIVRTRAERSIAGESSGTGPTSTMTQTRRAGEPFDYFTNSWTVVGLKDYPDGTRVSPSAELLLADGLVCRPLYGRSLRPLDWRGRKTLAGGYLPIVQYRPPAEGNVRYLLEVCACPADLSDAAAYDWPTGENFLILVRIRVSNISTHAADAHFGLVWQGQDRAPAGELGTLEGGPGGDVGGADAEGWATVVSNGALLGLLTLPAGTRLSFDAGRARLTVKLAPGAAAALTLRMSYQPLRETAPDTLRALRGLDFDACAERTASFWNGLLAHGAVLEVPEEKPLDTYKASLVYQFIGRDKGEVHAGEGFYDELYLRDGAYQVISLAQAGFLDAAQQSLEPFLRYQHENGQFWSQEGQLDANGYTIWALVEYYRLSGDANWLGRVYPLIQKSVNWIRQARRAEKDPGSPFYGILPAAPADGEFLWEGKNHIVGYDWWNLRGVQYAAIAARELGRGAEATEYEREFEEYRDCILKALELTGLPYIPPSYEKAGTHWGNLEAIFPSALIDAKDARLRATLRYVREQFGTAEGRTGGFIEGVIQWSPGVHQPAAIHPYMSQFVTNSHVIRGEYEQAIDGFYSFLLHTTATHGFPEGVHFRQRQAWGDTLPHLWAAAMYVTTLRNLLVREQGQTLHLLSCVPAHWLDPGKHIRFDGAPTYFGQVGLEVAAEQDALRVVVAPPTRRPAERIVIHVPPRLEIAAASVNERALPVNDHQALTLPAEVARQKCTVTLRVRRTGSGPAMDFDSRVAAYEAESAGNLKPIPGLVGPSEAGALLDGIDEHACVKLDLRGLANTDPLTAPFNVPNAGEYRFNGLPLGDQVIGGVPFQIVDPVRNDGRGLVVLNGAHACAEFRRQVEIPVGTQGRFLCVLGNVTGWAPDDAGVGEWGAVGEYEIRYGDGSLQTIPLVTGRTVDDWAQAPWAGDVACGLWSRRWHLNVLTIRLQPKLVTSVVFRDLGTPASPVLAAVTVVK